MDIVVHIITTVVEQLQKPTLAFLIGGMVLAAASSKFEMPEPIYKLIVMLLLLKVGLSSGIAIAQANITELLVPAFAATVAGVAIVFLGRFALRKLRGVSDMDAMATAGLFGAVSASTLAAAMAMLEAEGVAYEGYIGALYPFMDVAALITAILVARMAAARKQTALVSGGTLALGGGSGRAPISFGAGGQEAGSLAKSILIDTLRSPAISALLLGIAIGLFAKPDAVYQEFYKPLFHGLLSLLMLVMGMEAWARLSELRKVAHAYLIYGICAPFLHGAIGLGLGLVAHHITGFSEGGMVLLAVMAASSSDISGPPTLRAALPEANPSAYIGTSTGIGTPIALLSIPIWMAAANYLVG
ncbi:sodium-dependent bicarbonate transport family permease [Rhodobacteraceae bacterium XHP0102]|nr:sodium-dependent bicarbonate transport family permease [Rhodobacteraceae bacterium XHP0102]